MNDSNETAANREVHRRALRAAEAATGARRWARRSASVASAVLLFGASPAISSPGVDGLADASTPFSATAKGCGAWGPPAPPTYGASVRLNSWEVV